MAVDAVVGTYEYPTPNETIFTGHHGPVVKSKKVKTGQGVLEAGLIVAASADGNVVPYGKESVTLGTGDGSATNFSGSFSNIPLAPGSITVTDGTQTLRDDGCGNLYGDGSGTVNYETGEIAVSFASAVASGASVTAEATNQPLGVLIERCDTDKEDAAAVLVHGTVWKERLLVGSSAPEAEDLKKLEDIGIWAMP